MKATLEFNLPTEETDYLVAVHGMDLYLTLWNLKQHYARMLNDGLTREEKLEAEGFFEILNTDLDARGISLEMFN